MMIQIIQIPLVSQSCLSFGRLRQLLGIDNLVLHMGPDEMPGTWAFYREGMSVTLFLIQQTDNGYLLSMDGLASYDDYRFLPYLVDSLSLCLNNEPFTSDGCSAYELYNENWVADTMGEEVAYLKCYLQLLVDSLSLCLNNEPFTSDGCSAYELYNENWVADTMGEEVAYLKCYLQLGLKYYLSLPIPSTNVYVDVATLRSVGVSIHSATPRIYGYVHYLLRANRLPCDEEVDNGPVEGAGEVEVSIHSATPRIYGYVHYLLRANRLPCDEEVDNGPVEGAGEVEVDVPQHQSIGTVLSWQTDGSETTESYGREDVELLLQLAEAYRRGEPCDGVVLNDSIGTVLSWQTDGSETTESYGREDVELLLQLAEAYRRGEPCDGVVLNDIATIYEHGIGVEADAEVAAHWYREAIRQGDHIGVEADAEVAAHWYREAIRQGDHTFAPTSLGDLYRKGAGRIAKDLHRAVAAYRQSVDPYAWYRLGQSYEEGWLPTSLGDLYRKGAGRIAKDLHRAVAAYRQSVDPYAWYRLGQSYEEGWLSTPDLDKAMEYYHRAAAVHHLPGTGWGKATRKAGSAPPI